MIGFHPSPYKHCYFLGRGFFGLLFRFFKESFAYIFVVSGFLLIKLFLISSARMNPRRRELRGLEQGWINPSRRNIRKYLVSEMSNLLKCRRVPKPLGNLPLDSCIFLC